MKFHFNLTNAVHHLTLFSNWSDTTILINITESQLECNDNLNNLKANSECKTLPTLLLPRNIRVKASLTFGMERPRAGTQEKEENFNEAKHNNGDMEDKSTTHTRRQEIRSPKAQRFAKATVSPVKSLLLANRIYWGWKWHTWTSSIWTKLLCKSKYTILDWAHGPTKFSTG